MLIQFLHQTFWGFLLYKITLSWIERHDKLLLKLQESYLMLLTYNKRCIFKYGDQMLVSDFLATLFEWLHYFTHTHWRLRRCSTKLTASTLPCNVTYLYIPSANPNSVRGHGAVDGTELDQINFTYVSRSQWQSGLRQVLFSAARTLGSHVWILLGAWMCVWVFLCCVVLCR
jgi:hypothetical protein